MMSQTVKSMHIVSASFLVGLVACGGSEPDQPAPEIEATAAVAESPASVAMDMEFAADLGVDLDEMTRLPTGLYYQDLTEGSGLGARDGHVLNVYYTGRLTTGEQFDSNTEGDGYSFQLGRRQVILGWEQGVQGMRIGGKRRLVIPPSLGYGQRGFPPVIPPSATLVFEVELLNIRL
jgi:FKBP-type peptidyl-prolyl cis-trans isomerase